MIGVGDQRVHQLVFSNELLMRLLAVG
jgi:hypothetical protein